MRRNMRRSRRLAGQRVQRAMTATAEHDQVIFRILSRVTSANDVMYLQLVSTAASLALPAIPLENFDF